MSERLNLVTGATGFCGSYVVRDLLDAGHRVIATDLAVMIENPKHRAMLANCGIDLEHPKLELVAADLLDPDSLAKLFEQPITHIFHTASLYDYSASLARLRRINVEGTRNLVELALKTELQCFVHWSTCGVFGKPYTASDGPRVNVPFAEDSPSPKNTPEEMKEPPGTYLVNDYSISKWEQEKLVWKAHREQGLPLIVVRPAPMYGPGSAYGHGGIILSIAQGLVPGLPVDSRNYITTSVHVEDMSGFACFIAERPEAIGEDYNVVDNSIISYQEFIRYIALLCGRRMSNIPFINLRLAQPIMVAAATFWAWLERVFKIPRVRVFEVQSATYVSSSYWLENRKSLNSGYVYKYPDVKEGLKDTIAWFRREGWLTDRNRLIQSSGATAKEIQPPANER